MDAVTITSMQKNIDESKKFHSFIGETLEHSNIEYLFASSDSAHHAFTFFTVKNC